MSEVQDFHRGYKGKSLRPASMPAKGGEKAGESLTYKGRWTEEPGHKKRGKEKQWWAGTLTAKNPDQNACLLKGIRKEEECEIIVTPIIAGARARS